MFRYAGSLSLSHDQQRLPSPLLPSATSLSLLLDFRQNLRIGYIFLLLTESLHNEL